MQETSEVGKAGKIVCTYFEGLIDKHMPNFSNLVHQQETSADGDGKAQESKKRKMTPPPQSTFSEKSGGDPVVHVH